MCRGTRDSQSLAALAIFGVQKYNTWRVYLSGAPAPTVALTRAIKNMVRRLSGDVIVPLSEVATICLRIAPDHLWPFLGAFEAYAGAMLDFTVLRYLQV